MGTFKKQWAIYKAISPRTAYLIGQFISSLDYAIEVGHRANRLWKLKSKRHRSDRYMVFLDEGQTTRFKEGW